MIRILFVLISVLLFIPHANASSTSASEVLALINIEREHYGLAKLVPDLKLNRAAEGHAVDMNNRNYFAHTSPDGEDMGARLRKAGAVYTSAGENIALGYTTAQTVVTGWMNSPGHRRNILNGKYLKVGIARFNNYWVQDFSN